MKLLYKDSNKLSETEIFFEDNIYSKVRIIFEDDNEYYVYYSNDITNQVYINRIINKHLKPHMFFTNNIEVIKNDEQFDYYYNWINNLSNFQALHKGELIDGGDWQPTFAMQSENKNV